MPETLSTFVEVISDDFQSTFSVVDEHTLANMMGFPADFVELTAIIQNYMPGVRVWFARATDSREAYDMYFVRADK